MKAIDLLGEELVTELHRDFHPFRSQIADAEQVRVALALSRQRRIAQVNARIERQWIDGIGSVVASIDADLYHRLVLLEGYETVTSPDYLRALLRDNDEIRVKSRSPKTTVALAHHYRDDQPGATGGEMQIDTAPAEMDATDLALVAGSHDEAGQSPRPPADQGESRPGSEGHEARTEAAA